MKASVRLCVNRYEQSEKCSDADSPYLTNGGTYFVPSAAFMRHDSHICDVTDAGFKAGSNVCVSNSSSKGRIRDILAAGMRSIISSPGLYAKEMQVEMSIRTTMEEYFTSSVFYVD